MQLTILVEDLCDHEDCLQTANTEVKKKKQLYDIGYLFQMEVDCVYLKSDVVFCWQLN